MPPSKADAGALSLARIAREAIGEYVRRWSAQPGLSEEALRALAGAVCKFYALEVATPAEYEEILGNAWSEVERGCSLLPVEYRCHLKEAARGIEGELSSAAGELPRMTVEVNDQSHSNFFTGVDGSLADGGLFVATPEPLPVGTKVAIKMRLPTADVETVGDVAWIDAQPERGMGVRLNELNLADNEPVMRVMATREPRSR